MASLGVLEVLIRTKDETGKGIKTAENNTKKLGNKLTSWTIAKGQMIAKFAEKAITSTANVMKSTVKSAFNAFAEYEQLEGGIQTLFDTKTSQASARVMNYAKEAYRTAGISANQYMETVTAFSASLIKSLSGDTVAAADVADMAIIDMADNVNKMGSSMESVENAYKGFAKGNYTMLDNLKLGYGGTRSEMERLLKDASKLTGQKYDIKNLADVYKAIHAIQEEMGIAGATEKEAMTTVEGSFKAAKAAWQDVLTSIGRGKDIKRTVKNFSQTLSVAFKNARPVIRNAISGVFTAIGEILPDLGGLVDDLIADMKSSDSPVLQKLGDALKGIKGTFESIVGFISNFPQEVKKLQDSDNPIKTAIGNALALIKSLFDDVKGLIDDWDGTVDKMRDSDNPIKSALADVLVTIKEGITGVCQLINGDWLAAVRTFKESDSEILNTVGEIANTFDTGRQRIQEFIDKTNEAFGASGKGGNVYESFARKMANSYAEVTDEAGFNKWLGDLKKGLREAEVSYDNVEKIARHFKRQGVGADQGGISASLLDLANPVYGMDDLVETWAALDDYYEENPIEPPVEPDLNDEQLQAEIKKAQEEASGGITLPVNPSIGMIGDPNWKEHAAPQGNWVGIPHNAKGDWNVSYDHAALLHRGEMVLTKSQARQYREGGMGNTSAIVSAIQGLRNDMANLKLVVGRKTFGRAVVDYGGNGVNDYIGGSESRAAAGYGT